MSRRLIINADDLGLASGVNSGIIEAHAHGVVTSTSLMVLRPAAEEGARLAIQHPALSVGLHFDDKDGIDLDDPAEVSRAFATQLHRFRELVGAEPTHVDSHHHSHASGTRLPFFSRLVAPLAVPLRHDGRVNYLGKFWGQDQAGDTALEQIRRDALLALIRSEVDEGFSEVGCHPARVTDDLDSSYLTERETELETLTADGLRAEIEAAGVELVSFREWQPLSQTG